jgi:hypothetical protein
MKHRLYILLTGIIASSCIKDKQITVEELPFQWVVLDHKLNYDYYSPSDTTLNALSLTIITNPGNTNLRFRFDYPQWSSVPGTKLGGEDYNVFRRTGGLFTNQYTGCGMGAGFGGSFEFMRAPAHASVDEYYQHYLCKDLVNTAYKVAEANEEITVPAGKFTTYTLQDTLSLTREYWDEKNGIIKFVLYDRNGVVSGEYRLSSRNF